MDSSLCEGIFIGSEEGIVFMSCYNFWNNFFYKSLNDFEDTIELWMVFVLSLGGGETWTQKDGCHHWERDVLGSHGTEEEDCWRSFFKVFSYSFLLEKKLLLFNFFVPWCYVNISVVCVCLWALSIKQILFAVYFILFSLPFHFSPLFTLILSSSLIYLHFIPLYSWLFYYGCCHASTNLISSFMLLKNPRCVLFILKQQLYYILCMSHWFLRQVAMICPQLTAKWTKKSLSRRWRKHPRLRVCLQCPRKFPFPQQV